ncbi:MAG: hypothetical protein QXN55_03735 [Candidatus Nitrosotenuis sp.]
MITLLIPEVSKVVDESVLLEDLPELSDGGSSSQLATHTPFTDGGGDGSSNCMQFPLPSQSIHAASTGFIDRWINKLAKINMTTATTIRLKPAAFRNYYCGYK